MNKLNNIKGLVAKLRTRIAALAFVALSVIASLGITGGVAYACSSGDTSCYNYGSLEYATFSNGEDMYASACKLDVNSSYYGPLWEIFVLNKLSPAISNANDFSIGYDDNQTRSYMSNSWYLGAVNQGDFYVSQLNPDGNVIRAYFDSVSYGSVFSSPYDISQINNCL